MDYSFDHRDGASGPNQKNASMLCWASIGPLKIVVKPSFNSVWKWKAFELNGHRHTSLWGKIMKHLWIRWPSTHLSFESRSGPRWAHPILFLKTEANIHLSFTSIHFYVIISFIHGIGHPLFQHLAWFCYLLWLPSSVHLSCSNISTGPFNC